MASPAVSNRHNLLILYEVEVVDISGRYYISKYCKEWTKHIITRPGVGENEVSCDHVIMWLSLCDHHSIM